jgi:hypothetical protein
MTMPSPVCDLAASKYIECGEAISSRARFCLKCGASQTKAAAANLIKCITCNAEIPEFAKFCEECGALQPTSPADSFEQVGEVLPQATVGKVSKQKRLFRLF